MAEHDGDPLAAFKETLLAYYEEEIMGEAYFAGLARRFTDAAHKRKLQRLAEIEHVTARTVAPLLEKHKLTPRSDASCARSAPRTSRPMRISPGAR